MTGSLVTGVDTDEFLAIVAFKIIGALTAIGIDVIDAYSAIFAGIGIAIIDIVFTVNAFKSGGALAGIGVF